MRPGASILLELLLSEAQCREFVTKFRWRLLFLPAVLTLIFTRWMLDVLTVKHFLVRVVMTTHGSFGPKTCRVFDAPNIAIRKWPLPFVNTKVQGSLQMSAQLQNHEMFDHSLEHD